MIPTNEQSAIINFIAAGRGDLLIEALAGTGKSSTIKMALPRSPQRSILVCAFNKRIQEEFAATLPPMPRTHAVHVKTFHGLGLGILMRHFPRLKVDKSATEQIVNKTVGRGMPWPVRRTCLRLVQICKETYAELAVDDRDLEIIGHERSLFENMSDNNIKIAVFGALRALEASTKITEREVIDFSDMVWLPIMLKLEPPSRYQATFVDETQDCSVPQWELLQRTRAPNGRIIAVGDQSQTLYQFRAADGRAWRAFEAMTPTRLPLTMTFRCDTAIVKQANAIVPQLRARPDAGPGEVTHAVRLEQLAEHLKKDIFLDTFVLSRNNVELLRTALMLWRQGVPYRLAADPDIIEPLYGVVDQLGKTHKPEFVSGLSTWYVTELAKAEAAHSVAWADRVVEQYQILMLIAEYVEPRKIRETLSTIMGFEAVTAITLSTVHKAKGLEASRVFLLKQTFARYQDRPADKPIPPEEDNILYVAITRAKHQLVWIEMPRKA